jgi:FtsP/CotA-like multicopper oxidase with cupredoxin domain
MENSERSAISLVAILVSVIALILTGIGVAVANNKADNAATSGASAAAPSEITLKEFSITGNLHVAHGGSVRVTNAGSMEHNFTVQGTSYASARIAPGASAVLDLSGLSDGTYTAVCNVPGHEASGMKVTITVGGTDTMAGMDMTSTTVADGSQPVMDPAAMDKMMAAVAQQYLDNIKTPLTKGVGGQPLAPKILADGTKEFDLTAEIVDWEVSAGKTVKAWTYNGTVPAPTIQVEVGDKVKVVLTNKLPESTSLHFHGIRVPNAMDGVDPYTQDPILPGASFTYSFTALEPSVGMYHSHHDAQIQVPNGMAGAFLIGSMPIPKSLGNLNVTQTVNMVLNDSGTIGLSLNGKSFPATQVYAMKVGETMIVNYFNEGLLIHPMHMHQPVGYVIAKDGHPLAEPIPEDTIAVAPGERYTVAYTAQDKGVWAWHCHILNHAEGPTGMFGMVTAVVVS